MKKNITSNKVEIKIYNVAKRIMNILSNFQEYKILRKFLERKLQVAGNESLQINEMEMDYHDE